MKIEILEHSDEGPTFAWNVFGLLLGLFSRKALALAAATGANPSPATISKMKGAAAGFHAFRYDSESFSDSQETADRTTLFGAFDDEGAIVEPTDDEAEFCRLVGLPASGSAFAS